MAFLDSDDRKKIKVQITGGVIMFILVFVWPFLTGFIKSTDDGREALKIVGELSVRHDTLEARCAKKAFDDALFKQEVLQKMEYYDAGQKEIGSDVKDIKKILMSKNK